MQTIYYSTANFISRTNNVVDLEEYRRKLALAQEGNLAPRPHGENLTVEEEWEAAPVLQEVRPRRSRQRRSRALLLDLCASLSVVVMTLTFTLRVLMM